LGELPLPMQERLVVMVVTRVEVVVWIVEGVMVDLMLTVLVAAYFVLVPAMHCV
jgi:hypothetical protein